MYNIGALPPWLDISGYYGHRTRLIHSDSYRMATPSSPNIQYFEDTDGHDPSPWALIRSKQTLPVELCVQEEI